MAYSSLPQGEREEEEEEGGGRENEHGRRYSHLLAEADEADDDDGDDGGQQSHRLSFRPLSLRLHDLGSPSAIMDGAGLFGGDARASASTRSNSYDMLSGPDDEPDGRHERALAGERNAISQRPGHDSGRPAAETASERARRQAMKPQSPSAQTGDGASPGSRSGVGIPSVGVPHDGLSVRIPPSAASSSPDTALLTASSEGSVDLHHPTPGLESLQGAYVGNVERLERTAERLSIASSDIGDELRRMKMEQRRPTTAASASQRSSITRNLSEADLPPLPPPPSRHFSAGSFASSIIGTNRSARSGGYSPAGYLTSPPGSILSRSYSQSGRGQSASGAARLAQLPEPEPEPQARPLDASSASSASYPASIASPPTRSAPVPDEDETMHAVPQRHRDDALRHLDGSIAGSDGRQSPALLADHARNLFGDFDGVHCSPVDASFPPPARRLSRASSRASSRRGRPQSYAESSAGGNANMVFYPAPVPVMLNLPKRLSKMPSPMQREHRHTKLTEPQPPAPARSSLFLPELGFGSPAVDVDAQVEEYKAAARRSSNALPRETDDVAGLPPQLRASVFFDKPAPAQEVEVREDSAVATLDSILNASAHAPVNAFTDHPIVGQAGAKVYKKEAVRKRASAMQLPAPDAKASARKSRSSLNLLLGKRSSSGTILEDRTKMSSRITVATGSDSHGRNGGLEDIEDQEETEPGPDGVAVRHSSAPDPHAARRPTTMVDGDRDMHGSEPDDAEGAPDEAVEIEDGESEANGEGQYERPTTLLAELQLRKHQLKQRTRTAATHYPNGMHSTLLELDAVARVQKEARRHKHVSLAWEDPHSAPPAAAEALDDDVPLAVLYPGGRQNQRLDETIPLGLMEKREIEDSEPLSRRRERLRGGLPIARGPSPPPPSPKKFLLEVPGLTDQVELASDDEAETLAQRIRRLRGQDAKPTKANRQSTISADFASELMSQFAGEDEKQKGRRQQSDERQRQQQPEQAPDPEQETLGQRRKRLQAEREARDRELGGSGGPVTDDRPPVPPKHRHSMADILQKHPAAGARPHTQVLHEPQRNTLGGAYFGQTGYDGYGGMVSGRGIGGFGGAYAGLGMDMNGFGKPTSAVYNYPTAYPNSYGGTAAATNGWAARGMPYGGGGVAEPSMAHLGPAQVDLDPQRRDLIDRWRQSVMP
ncbi:MAG: hypothetical protein M1832_003315 [Thelocarpon impressellum]|nr:MAG: hypothetical protein M1832_003315 [Thelocarpon impressellum]